MSEINDDVQHCIARIRLWIKEARSAISYHFYDGREPVTVYDKLWPKAVDAIEKQLELAEGAWNQTPGFEEAEQEYARDAIYRLHDALGVAE